jgi:hypothetical protein
LPELDFESSVSTNSTIPPKLYKTLQAVTPLKPMYNCVLA